MRNAGKALGTTWRRISSSPEHPDRVFWPHVEGLLGKEQAGFIQVVWAGTELVSGTDSPELEAALGAAAHADSSPHVHLL